VKHRGGERAARREAGGGHRRGRRQKRRLAYDDALLSWEVFVVAVAVAVWDPGAQPRDDGLQRGRILRCDDDGATRDSGESMRAALKAIGGTRRMGGGWTTSTPSATRVVGTLGGAEKIPRTRVGGRPGLGTVSRRSDVADAGDVPRGWRPSRRAAGSTRRPQHRGPRRARLNAADGENTSKRITRTREGCPQEKRKKDVRGAPACRVTSRRVAEANTRRRDAGASRRQLRDERRAVLRVHGGRLLRHKRFTAGARSGGVDESFSRVIRMPTRALTTPNTAKTPT
jgi:hypothetical protein